MMGFLIFTSNHQFKTKGIWAAKGRKNLYLPPKEANAKVKSISEEELKLSFAHIDLEDGMSRISFNIGKEGLNSGGILKINYDENSNGFEINLKGEMKIEIEDSFVELFKNDGKKLQFRLMGVITKEGPFFGGYISRPEIFDRDANNYQDCPLVTVKLIE